MNAEISVPDDMQLAAEVFAAAEGLPVVFNPDASIVVKPSPSGRLAESDRYCLYAGGWISCSAARALARALGLSEQHTGRLLDHFDIRLRQCGFGCF